MNKLIAALPEEARQNLHEVGQPSWMDPMLATLTKRRFSDKNWIFERKLDGERCLTFRDGKAIRLLSRNQKELNVKYPELVDAVKKQTEEHFILDGEIVTFKGNVTSFARLQERMHIEDEEEARQSDMAVYYYIFDMLYLDRYDITEMPLRHRKSLLKGTLSFEDPLRFVIHRNTDGENYFKQACQKGWEGIIAKQAESSYIHSRSKKWLKFKCINQQELVIGGYTEPHGERIGFGALLLGYYQDGDLMYAGKVGTGFDNETLKSLHKSLSSAEVDSPPFNQGDLPHKEVHWVKPDFVAEIGFEEWTDEGKLRQPRYLGLRDDKDAENVVREEHAT